MTLIDPQSDRAGDEQPRGAANAEFPALTWMRRVRAEEEVLVEVARQVRHRRRKRAVIASSVFAALVIAGTVWNSGGWDREHGIQIVSGQATILRPERQILPDGSTVELNAGAKIEVHYEPVTRRIVLISGEAHFDVQTSARPFVVEAGAVAIRAVGTAFSVQRATQQVEVFVTEGQVQLSRTVGLASDPMAGLQASVAEANPADSLPSHPIVSAGHRAVMEFSQATPRINAVSEAEVTQLQAWRIPVLEFSRTPMAEVVELMNRHAHGHEAAEFVIADAELHALKLSGFLRTDNREGLVRLLETQFGVTVKRSGKTIVLHRAR